MTWYKKHTVCKVLKEEDPKVFEEKIADLLRKTQRTEPIVKYDNGYFIAVLTYEEFDFPDDEKETVADEFHRQGIRYVCAQCPHLEQDGDKRRKYHTCKYAELGTAREDQECCELFYKQLKQGNVIPRL